MVILIAVGRLVLLLVRGVRCGALRLRLATGMLYGDTPQQREAALAAADPLTLPWIAATLARLHDILADLASRPQDPAVRLGT